MRPSCIAGFTLIEVLVAVLVLGIGVLGAAGVQVAVLRTRQGTAYTTSAVQLASTLADRMRAGAGQSGMPAPYLQLAYDAVADGAPQSPAQSCFSGSACTAEQMATFDAYDVAHALYTRFPAGRIVVCRDAAVLAASPLAWPCEGNSNAPLVIKLGWQVRTQGNQAGTPPRPSLALVVAAGGT